MIFGRGGVGRRDQPRHPSGGMGDVARAHPAARLVGQPARHRRCRPGLDRRMSLRASPRVYEDSDSYRDGVEPERYGANPTVACRARTATTLRAGYEYFHDERTADRGISSFNGRPRRHRSSDLLRRPRPQRLRRDGQRPDGRCWSTNSAVTSPAQPPQLRRLRQVLPERLPGRGERRRHDGEHLGLQQRHPASEPLQPDRPGDDQRTGADRPHVPGRLRARTAGKRQLPQHRLLHQLGPTVTSVLVPISNPTTDLPLEFRQGLTDADNHGVATVAALYVQDQITSRRASRRWSACATTSSTWTSTTIATAPISVERRRSAVTTHRPRSTSRSNRCRSTAATACPTCRAPASSSARCRRPTGARPGGVHQLRARREVGRLPEPGLHRRRLPPRARQRRRAGPGRRPRARSWSTRSAPTASRSASPAG